MIKILCASLWNATMTEWKETCCSCLSSSKWKQRTDFQNLDYFFCVPFTVWAIAIITPNRSLTVSSRNWTKLKEMVKVMQVISKTHLLRRDPAPSLLVCNAHTQICGRNSQNLVMKQKVSFWARLIAENCSFLVLEHLILNDFLLKIYYVFYLVSSTRLQSPVGDSPIQCQNPSSN